MSRAILILDKMPENCMNCRLRYKDGDTDEWFRFRCHISEDQIPKEGKLNNCPLKPMPRKLPIESGSIMNTFKESTKYKHIGYNKCIDEILGG